MNTSTINDDKNRTLTRLLWSDAEAKHLFKQNLWPYYIGNKNACLSDRECGGIYPILLWKEQIPYAVQIPKTVKRKFEELEDRSSTDLQPLAKKQNSSFFSIAYSFISSASHFFTYPFLLLFTTQKTQPSLVQEHEKRDLVSLSTTHQTSLSSMPQNVDVIDSLSAALGNDLTKDKYFSNRVDDYSNSSNYNMSSSTRSFFPSPSQTSSTYSSSLSASSQLSTKRETEEVAETETHLHRFAHPEAFTKDNIRSKIFASIKNSGYFIGPGDLYGKATVLYMI